MNDPKPITFVDAIAAGFRNWRNTTGTATRHEFWFWFLFTVLVSLVVSTLDSVLFPVTEFDLMADSALTGEQLRVVLDTTVQETIWSLSTLVSLVLFIPSLTVLMRRFRDAGVNPVLAGVIQFFGPVSSVAVYFLVYAMTDLLVTSPTDAQIGELVVLAFVLLGIAVLNLVAFVMMIVVASRPTRTDGTF